MVVVAGRKQECGGGRGAENRLGDERWWTTDWYVSGQIGCWKGVVAKNRNPR